MSKYVSMSARMKTITVGTSAVQVDSVDLNQSDLVQIRALSTNTANICLKYNSNVVVDDPTGYILEPGAVLSIYSARMNLLHAISSAAGQRLTFHIGN